MFSYRITKYNPKNRDSKGAYLLEDWTAISDIGNQYDGNKLTFETYINIENSYIETIVLFMYFLELNFLCVSHLEKHRMSVKESLYLSKTMRKTYKELSDNMLVNKDEVRNIARMVLRELIWCKLESKDMFVHFGYDYYMYIGSSKKISKSLKSKIESLGLFVEYFESPYLEN